MTMETRDVTVEIREVAGFDSVILRGSVCCAEVYIEQGEAETLKIEAAADIIQRIETSVRDHRLVIRLRGSWLEKLTDLMTNELTRPKMIFHLEVRELKSLDVYGASYIHAPFLDTGSLVINWRGAGDLVFDSISAQKLKVEQSGAGSMEIAGQVGLQIVNLSGVGRYDSSRLMTESTEVHVSGSSFARVHASETLKAVVRGVGVVEYAGDPLVSTRVTGAGSVVRSG
jgi:hypothetical protein